MDIGEIEPSAWRGGELRAPAPASVVTFSRRELDRILGLYGRMVAAGEWRDYAIDFLKDRAVFSVFRRAAEVPIYRIEKNPRLGRRQGAYSVISATGHILRRGHELDRVLSALDRSSGWLPGKGRYGGDASPLPSARCISTVSSQRPCLKPIDWKLPMSRKPTAAWTATDAVLAESPITPII